MDKTRIASSITFLFFVPLVLLSNQIAILLKSSSLRDGLIFNLCIIILYFFFLISKIKIDIKIPIGFVFLAIYSLLQFLLIIFVEDNTDNKRFALSFLLILLLFIASKIYTNVAFLSEYRFSRILLFILFVLLGIGLLACLLLLTGKANKRDAVLLFNEPSHYALVVLPFFNYYIISNKKHKILLVLLFFFISLAIQNLTLLVGILFSFFVKVKNKYKILAALLIVLLLLIALQFDRNDYFSARLKFTGNIKNHSVLVWLSGWERAILSLRYSKLVGLGLQQLGVYGPNGKYMMRLLEITRGVPLNQFDGGFLASKIISEYGIMGLLIIISYFKRFIKYMIIFDKNGIEDDRLLFFYSVFTMFFIQLFVRGTGYFSSSTFLFLISIIYLNENLPLKYNDNTDY